ncbi:MAG: monooxygenase, partial [Armatimonadota bacterium]
MVRTEEPDVAEREVTEIADELRARYAEEREKRLRPEANAQYVPISDVSDFDADPFTPLVPREPLAVTTDALIVGAGWGGMATAASLREQGVDDILI